MPSTEEKIDEILKVSLGYNERSKTIAADVATMGEAVGALDVKVDGLGHTVRELSDDVKTQGNKVTTLDEERILTHGRKLERDEQRARTFSSGTNMRWGVGLAAVIVLGVAAALFQAAVALLS
jgi:uncharacterized protein YoxC